MSLHTTPNAWWGDALTPPPFFFYKLEFESYKKISENTGHDPDSDHGIIESQEHSENLGWGSDSSGVAQTLTEDSWVEPIGRRSRVGNIPRKVNRKKVALQTWSPTPIHVKVMVIDGVCVHTFSFNFICMKVIEIQNALPSTLQIPRYHCFVKSLEGMNSDKCMKRLRTQIDTQ